jgi:hypothetical protein
MFIYCRRVVPSFRRHPQRVGLRSMSWASAAINYLRLPKVHSRDELLGSGRFVPHVLQAVDACRRRFFPILPAIYTSLTLNEIIYYSAHAFKAQIVLLPDMIFCPAKPFATVNLFAASLGRLELQNETSYQRHDSLFIWSVFFHSGSTLPHATVEKSSRANQFNIY